MSCFQVPGQRFSHIFDLDSHLFQLVRNTQPMEKKTMINVKIFFMTFSSFVQPGLGKVLPAGPRMSGNPGKNPR